MYAWIWRRLPFGRPGKIIGSLILTAVTVAGVWVLGFPAAQPLLPFWAGRGAAVTRARNTATGRHLYAADRTVRGRVSDLRRVPGSPGVRRRVWRDRHPRTGIAARKDVGGLSRRRRSARRAAQPVHRDP